MTDYEWEPRRVPRPARTDYLANYHPRHRAVAEFVALEHPREHVGWVLKQHAEGRLRPWFLDRNRKAKTGKPEER